MATSGGQAATSDATAQLQRLLSSPKHLRAIQPVGNAHRGCGSRLGRSSRGLCCLRLAAAASKHVLEGGQRQLTAWCANSLIKALKACAEANAAIRLLKSKNGSCLRVRAAYCSRCSLLLPFFLFLPSLPIQTTTRQPMRSQASIR